MIGFLLGLRSETLALVWRDFFKIKRADIDAMVGNANHGIYAEIIVLTTFGVFLCE